MQTMKRETLTFKTVSLPCGQNEQGKLCTTNLFRGPCPHECAYCYARGLKGYSEGLTQPMPVAAVKNVRRWPPRLFLSSASDPSHPLAVGTAEELLRRALPTGTFVVISTKALATAGILEILKDYPDQVSYTVSLSSLNEERNSLLEPKAATAKERLYGRQDGGTSLYGIKHLVQNGIKVTLKADTLFPGIDDTEESLFPLLEEARACGVRAVNFSYAFFRSKFRKQLEAIPFLQESLVSMTERQPIASGKGYSLPLSEKRKRLLAMADVAKEMGYEVISTCRCKNQIGNMPEGSALRPICHFHDRWF